MSTSSVSSDQDAHERQYISLYNYTPLEKEQLPRLRRKVYAVWRKFDVLGRIYLASEGINAQLTVPVAHIESFSTSFPELFTKDNINFGAKFQPGSKKKSNDQLTSPFDSLEVRIRKQIVADGFTNGHLDLQDSGNALPPDQWHHKLQHRNQHQDDSTLVLDVRNFYEHEIGRFDGATRIMVDTFRDTFDALDDILKQHEEEHGGEMPREVMMYCTGGIRCEKVGAYLKQYKGIDNIHKLKGGIVHYQKFLKAHPEESSLFKGKNFVFDQRCVSDELAESSEEVTSDVLGKCFQCGSPCNDHTNCSNTMCGGLLLQCPACRSVFDGACSKTCQDEVRKMRAMSEDAARKYRKENASRWMPVVPNALSRLQRTSSAREYCSSVGLGKPSPLSLSGYVQDASTDLDDENLLRELRLATHEQWPKAEQLIDEPQGKLLSFLVHLTAAKDVLEIGCFTGYSAISLANGLQEDGSVTTCDINQDTMSFAKAFFERSSRSQQIKSVLSDGKDYLEECGEACRQFDLIFVDANKRQYINYYESILRLGLLRKNGLLVFDNTLFRGRVLAHVNGEANKKERIAQGLAEFNSHVAQDPRTVNVLLPIWDGLTIIRHV
ncbi:hypothetical protein Poli38472_000883 [Pythium oligandrum]|uniref:Rhodanese domain-containing protein n=1 Tax=Pythium oligandrum TaxID=41045 RepID=A0A8K1FFR7_PYTOL|nr:hypothetical protein Poli38472_000883 [Pythium oligandrum]|eukprot:TMW60841.1 hypothetical protein Poli38472_000883 [Pythium oligandrum]